MSYLRAVYEKLVRDIEKYNEAEKDYNRGKLEERFKGRCGFTGESIENKNLYRKYTYFSVRGISYECSQYTKDMYGNKTSKVISTGFLPMKQQKIEVAVTESGVNEFIINQNKKAWIGNNIPVFILLLILLLGVGVVLFFVSLFYLFPFFQAFPAGGLLSIGALLGVGIVLPFMIIISYISWFARMRKIKKTGTDLDKMDREQRKFINETIKENVVKQIKFMVNDAWKNPKKDTSIIVDGKWMLDTHSCISRYDHRIMRKDKQDNINGILDNIKNAGTDRVLAEKIIKNELWQ